MADAIPSQIGRYKILEEIGRGGFGCVYRAFDPSVGRNVAVKILMEANKEVLSRFRKEATVVGNLRHKNIVTVYEYGEHEGKPFLAMEYLEGQTLQQIIRLRQPLTLLEKCKIMLQVAEGLNGAHRSGIVHRDVKPANIIVMPDGTVKIMDFGIARAVEDSTAARLTQQGYLVGTVQYMSPEQFSGAAQADALSDVFAFGVVFYEFATGHHPFEGPDSRVLMYKISFEEPPPIRTFVPDFPDALQEIVNKALKKDRELRYQSLTAAVFDLEPIRLELQRQRADALLIVAQKHFDDKELEQAQSVALEALGFDPANRAARAIWDGIQRQLQRLALQSRIDSLVLTGEENIAQRRFAEAVQNFESALRLEANDVRLQERLEYARDYRNRSSQAASLLAESRKEFGRENMTAARQLVSEALRQDSTHPKAREFQREIEAAIERRRRDQRVVEATQKAEGLLSLNSFDEAAGVLTELGPDAESPAVKQLLDRIQVAKREEQQRQKMRAQTAFATQCLREGRPNEAVQCLEILSVDFPANDEVGKLLAYSRKELEAQRKANAIREVSTEVHALVNAKDFYAALSSLERILAVYPGDSHLVRLVASTMAAKDEFERERSVEATINKCEELRLLHRFGEAIEFVEAALREYPGEETLSRLLQQLELAWEQHRRLQAVKKVEEKATLLLSEQQPERAVPLLQQILAQYPDEPVLLELLTRAKEEIKRREKLRAINAVREEMTRFLQVNAFDSAFAAIDQALENWPGDPDLISRRQEVVARKREFERQKAVTEYALRSRQLLDAKQFHEATNLIFSARKEFPDESSLIQLAGEIAAEWEAHKRRESIGEIASQSRVLISRGRLDDAIEILDEGLASYPGVSDLLSLKAEALKAREAREHAASVRRISAASRKLTKEGQFQNAIEILEEGLGKYPEDADLKGELSSVLAAKTAWERVAAIDAVIQTAKQLAAEEHFQEAQDRLDQALKSLGREPVLLEARSAIEKEFALYEQKRAIRRIASEVNGLLDDCRPDEALSLLKDAASRYADTSEWSPLISRAQNDIAARERAEERSREIHRTETNANDLAGKHMFDAALELVAREQEKYPQDPNLDALRTRLNASAAEYEYAEAVRQASAQTDSLIGSGQFEGALERLKSLTEQYPREAVFDSLREKAEALLEVRGHRDAIAGEAEALITKGDFGEAISLLERALPEFPGDGILSSALARARDQENRRQERERAIERAVSAIQPLAGERRFAEAQERVAAALKEFGETPALNAIQGELRMRKAIADAEALIEQSRPADALNLIKEEAASSLHEPDVVAVIQKAREQRIAQQRSAAVAEHVRQARHEAETDLDSALRLVEDGLRKWPGAGPLVELRSDLLAARSARERQKSIEEAVRQCEQLEKEKGCQAALELVQILLRNFENEPALRNIYDRLEANSVQERKRERRERDLSELKAIAAQIATLPAIASVRTLLARIQEIVAQYPNDADILAAAAPGITHLTAIQNAERELISGNFEAVLTICTPYLQEDARHVIFSALKADAESRLRIAYIKKVREQIGKQSSLEDRIRLLEEVLPRYPSETWAADELRLNRNRLLLLNSTVEKARVAEAAEEWDEALEQLSRIPTIYDGYPNLEVEVARVRNERARAREAKTVKWVGQISEILNAGNLRGAGELLRQAQNELPDVAVLESLSKQLEELRKKRKRAQELLSKARKVLPTDPHGAESLVAEAASIDASVTPSADLLRCLTDRKKRIAVDDALSGTEQLRASGNLAGALLRIETAAQEYPDETSLEALRESIATEIRQKRESVSNELNRIKEAADQELSIPNLQALRDRASAIARDPHIESDLKSTADAVVLALNARIRHLGRLHLWSEIATRRKPVMVAASALVLLAVGWFAVASAISARREIPVTITSDPGVLAQVNGKECRGPKCTLNLKPGTYELLATQDGYEPQKRPLVLKPHQAAETVSLHLNALPEILQVNTNFSDGQVLIDKRKSGDLVNGAFSTRISYGEHSIEVSGGGETFGAVWRSQAGAAPAVGPLVTKDLIATVVASVGTKATIESTYVSQPIKIDGTPAGKTGSAPDVPAEISLLKEGLREIEIAGRKMSLEVRPNPTLNLDLALDRNVGTLLVVTNLSDANVYLNNHPYGRTTVTGILRLAIDVGKYEVRVEKDGFRASEKQTVELAKGDQQIKKFTLVPMAGILEITGAPSGAEVSVDGQKKGQITAARTFPVEGLPPGAHQIDITKDGYVPFHSPVLITGGQTMRANGTMALVPRPDPEAEAWTRVKTSSDPTDLDNFVKQYPGSIHVGEAQTLAGQLRQAARNKQEDDAWSAVNRKDKTALTNFSSKYRNGRHTGEANSALKELQNEENDAWSAVDKTNETALINFISTYGNSEHIKDAQSSLDEIRKAQGAATARQEKERAEQQKQRDKDAVIATLMRYAAGFDHMSVSEVQGAFPTAKRPEPLFKAAIPGSISAKMQPTSDIVVAGDSAIVDCRWTLEFTSKDHVKRSSQPAIYRITLMRSGSTWVIKEMKAR